MAQFSALAMEVAMAAHATHVGAHGSGSAADLVQLHQRVQSNYTLERLDELLPYFDIPDPEIDWGQDSGDALARAYIALVVLLEVSSACESNLRTLAIPTAEKLIPSFKGILYWMCAILHLRPSSNLSLLEGITRMDVDEPQPHEVCASVLLSIGAIDPSLERKILLHPLVINLSLMWWIITRDGHPLVYVLGSRNSTSDEDSGHDPIITLAHRIFIHNPKGSTTAVQTGYVCSPRLFFTRASERMQLLVNLPRLAHLAHVEASALEIDNLQSIVAVVNTIIQTDTQLVVPMAKASTPHGCMKALVSARLQGLFMDSDSRRAEVEGALLKLARDVAKWALLSGCRYYPQIVKSFVNDPATRVSRLLGDFTSVYITPSRNPRYEPFEHLLQSLLGWAFKSPTILTLVHAALQTDIPKIGLFAGTIASPERTAILLHVISQVACLSPKADPSVWPCICDNSNHKSCFGRAMKEAAPSMVCSQCLSVTYCSQNCQREDWENHHRKECRSMRKEYFANRFSNGLRYSQRLRGFHAATLQHSHEPGSPLFKLAKVPIPDPWSKRTDYLGRTIVLTIHMANSLDPISIDALQEFINMTVPLIPKHLAKRFKALLRKFMAADPADHAGQFSLVNGVFYYANVEVNHLALVRRTQTAAPTGSKPAVRIEIDESMVYVGSCRNPYEERGGLEGHPARNYELMYGPNHPGLREFLESGPGQRKQYRRAL
ncbi:hypothetical protein FA13DRAFT_1735500 [Coprinellus micaceus]|uniref:MYND-type domain-containing protein n=1 Tax=Coprinellus micaceus TaxID=71717 RepID=A0A4Y7T3F5_COPMI|nr:hypothetical protein FA13DRAFT_1735500 [Coprinellus micaceus]